MIAWFVASHLISRFVGGGLLKLFVGNLMGDLNKLWGWLCHRSFWQIISLLLAIILIIQTIRVKAEQRHTHKVETQLSKAIAGREADRRAYVKAQADAAALNKVQVARVKQQQQEITDATVSHLSARLELIRSELRRATPQSSAGSSPASDPGTAPCRVIDPAWMCLSPEDRLRAAESEERHDELIDWNIAQSKVDPNKP